MLTWTAEQRLACGCLCSRVAVAMCCLAACTIHEPCTAGPPLLLVPCKSWSCLHSSRIQALRPAWHALRCQCQASSWAVQERCHAHLAPREADEVLLVGEALDGLSKPSL